MLPVFMVVFMVVSTEFVVSVYGLKPKPPDVLVVLLVSNEEHLLSTFFGGFEQLTYPKENIGKCLMISFHFEMIVPNTNDDSK